jgi:hypothetical protein
LSLSPIFSTSVIAKMGPTESEWLDHELSLQASVELTISKEVTASPSAPSATAAADKDTITSPTVIGQETISLDQTMTTMYPENDCRSPGPIKDGGTCRGRDEWVDGDLPWQTFVRPGRGSCLYRRRTGRSSSGKTNHFEITWCYCPCRPHGGHFQSTSLCQC